MKTRYPWFLLMLLVAVLDQVSKIWVSANFALYQSVKLLPGVNLTLAVNTGSAFSFLSEAGAWHHWFFIAFGVLMTAILVVWMVKTASSDYLQLVALAFIAGGALGNLTDRLRLGHVIDFIDLYYANYHWPVFNLADSAICVGAVLLLWALSEWRKLPSTKF